MGEVGSGADASSFTSIREQATFEEAMQLDEVTLERVNALKKAKEMAIRAEDFDEA